MIFLRLHYNQCFFLLLQEVATIFSDSSVHMPFKSSANATCWEADALLPSLDFLPGLAKRGIMPRAYIANVVGSPCVVPSSDFMDRLL